MTKLNEILKEYNIEYDVPTKFGELDKFDTENITDYHTETEDGNEIHVFVDTSEDDTTDEWLLDLKNLTLSKVVKKEGQEMYYGYESYEYIEDVDDIKISNY